jgi:metal-responsive CopG/Arc/MetJ family transcriptional regulator
MNRRIKRNRAVPIHITMPPALLDEIDARLSHKTSRSNWIRGACDLKLGNDVTGVQDLTDVQLVNVLRNRFNYEGPGEAILKSLLEILSKQS